MGEILNNLKDEYKQKKKEAISAEAKKLIKHDYKEMKQKVKEAEKIIKKNNLNESTDEFWSKFDFPSFDEFKEKNVISEDNETFKEMNDKIEASKKQYEEQKKHSEEVMRKADETIRQIDEKLAELEQKEALEKGKKAYNDWKSEVLARIDSEEYQSLEQAKEKAKTIINKENDLTSVWEKDDKYYVILSRDREVAFRSDYKEVVKYDDLLETIKKDVD